MGDPRPVGKAAGVPTPLDFASLDRLHPRLPHTLETVVGGALELAIHSVEGVRELIVRRALLRAMRAMSATPET